MNKGLYTSSTPEWITPQKIFDELNVEFNFTLDPCSTHENAKCQKHYTAKENGLLQSWEKEVVFMNPPYGKTIKYWVQKAYEESINGATVVCLLPARTDTKWFHDYIYQKAEIKFIKGRLKFSQSKHSAPFPSMIVIFNSRS